MAIEEVFKKSNIKIIIIKIEKKIQIILKNNTNKMMILPKKILKYVKIRMQKIQMKHNHIKSL